MLVSLEQFIENLIASGLFTAAELSAFREALPPGRRPDDAQGLARELFHAGKLTKYQAAAIYQGKTAGLVLGDYVTLDFTQEGRRKVNLFSYVLGYSRRQYIHFTASQDLETTLREHVRAFEHLQGVAAT